MVFVCSTIVAKYNIFRSLIDIVIDIVVKRCYYIVSNIYIYL